MKKIILPLMIVAILFTGCTSQRPTELSATMHFTNILVKYEKLSKSFDADLHFAVTENAAGTSDVSFNLKFLDSPEHIPVDLEGSDFQYEKNSFELIYTEEDLPYDCIKAYVKNTVTDGMYNCFMAIDTEKEYMIISYTDVDYAYVVASSDPDVDPYVIEEHFERFIELRAGAQQEGGRYDSHWSTYD